MATQEELQKYLITDLTGLNQKAQEDASNIDAFLKTFPPGSLISKTSLKLKFNLPHSRSYMIYAILKIKGYTIEKSGIRVP